MSHPLLGHDESGSTRSRKNSREAVVPMESFDSFPRPSLKEKGRGRGTVVGGTGTSSSSSTSIAHTPLAQFPPTATFSRPRKVEPRSAKARARSMSGPKIIVDKQEQEFLETERGFSKVRRAFDAGIDQSRNSSRITSRTRERTRSAPNLHRHFIYRDYAGGRVDQNTSDRWHRKRRSRSAADYSFERPSYSRDYHPDPSRSLAEPDYDATYAYTPPPPAVKNSEFHLLQPSSRKRMGFTKSGIVHGHHEARKDKNHNLFYNTGEISYLPRRVVPELRPRPRDDALHDASLYQEGSVYHPFPTEDRTAGPDHQRRPATPAATTNAPAHLLHSELSRAAHSIAVLQEELDTQMEKEAKAIQLLDHFETVFRRYGVLIPQ
ncbi:unnamed protein product [Amoebophrya sp. A25]|nr:unnamed protein product [Amoebophrya sp. A25]|eukprot:GSA25T00001268001.1